MRKDVPKVYADKEDSCQRILVMLTEHYENTPIQMCRKFHLQKLKIGWNM